MNNLPMFNDGAESEPTRPGTDPEAELLGVLEACVAALIRLGHAEIPCVLTANRLLEHARQRRSAGPEAFKAAWNEIAGGVLPRVTVLSPERRRRIEARIKAGLDIETFRRAVSVGLRTPFLRGQGAQGFVFGFDWMFEKPLAVRWILDGKYGEPTPETSAAGEARDDKQRREDEAMLEFSRKLDAGNPAAIRMKPNILAWRESYKRRTGKNPQ